jgi:hypothetical protein
MTKPLFFSNFFLQPFTEEKPRERERERDGHRQREMGRERVLISPSETKR